MSNQTKRGPGRGPGSGPGMGVVEKPKDFRGAAKKLASYAKPFRWLIVLVIIFALLSTVFNIVGPMFLGNITNELVRGVAAKLQGTGGIDFTLVGKIALLLVGLYVLSALFNYLQNFMMSGITQKITYRMRQQISQKMNQIPLRYYDTHSHGNILSRITNDIDTIGSTLQQGLMQMVTSAATVIGVLVMMLAISPLMTLIAVLILPVTLLSVGTLLHKSQRFFRRQQDALGSLNGHVEEMYGGHNVVKAFNGEERSIAEFKKQNEALYDASWKAQFISGLMMPIVNMVSNFGYVVVCVLGGYLVLKGSIQVGNIQAFIQYVRQFTQPLSQMAQITNVLQSTMAAAERVFEFLEEEEEVPESDHPVVLEKVLGHVQFEHVSFGYDADKVIIKDFNANIKPGQRVAIVGPTGAGKTTLINLLLRFYDVNQGAILVDGVDIREMRRYDLRQAFGMVLQDAWLFHGSIRENIAYGKPGASEEEIRQAAEAACADHFIQTLPDGYDMVINEDASNVSQGQRQLLTIARAILADAPIMILDEATSSVDTRTEVLIQKAMNRLMEGRTSFIIAHRLSTIRDADLILVLVGGNIVEQGTHQELLAKGGFYAKLYNSQFEEAAS